MIKRNIGEINQVYCCFLLMKNTFFPFLLLLFLLLLKPIFSHIFQFGFAPLLMLYKILYLSENKVYVIVVDLLCLGVVVISTSPIIISTVNV